MTTDVRKHTAPAAGETPRRQALNDLSLSINDIIPVSGPTEAAQKLADIGATTARPLWIWRADLSAAWALQYSTGGAFKRVGGREYYSVPGGSAAGLDSAIIIGTTIEAPGFPYRAIIDGTLRLDLNAPADFSVILRYAPAGQLATSAVDQDVHDLRTAGGTAHVHTIREVGTNIPIDVGLYIQRTSGSGTATVVGTRTVNRLDIIIEPP